MTFFQSLRLENFQCWKDLTIDFDTFTVIVGSSGTGKSSIYRALSFLTSSYFKQAFISDGADWMRVTLTFSDGTVLSKYKSLTLDQKYVITYPDGSSKEFMRFGRVIPEEISKVLCMGFIVNSEGSYSVNLSPQFDTPFLLSSPTQAARVISSILGLSDLPNAKKKITKDIRALDKEVKVTQSFIKKIPEEVYTSLSLVHRLEIAQEAKVSLLECLLPLEGIEVPPLLIPTEDTQFPILDLPVVCRPYPSIDIKDIEFPILSLNLVSKPMDLIEITDIEVYVVLIKLDLLRSTVKDIQDDLEKVNAILIIKEMQLEGTVCDTCGRKF